jgi:hypothetical protein
VQIINLFGGKESIDRRKAWDKVLLLRKPARRHMRVCGKHFLREDFINRKFHEFEVKSLWFILLFSIPRSISQKLRLKEFAVPSQKLSKGHTTQTQRKFASKITGKVDCSALDIISEKVIVLNKKTFSLLMYFY